MAAIISWIIAGVVGAWGIISGATAIAGAAMLATALSAIPARMGTAPQAWLNVINYYIPLNESCSLFVVFLGVAAAMKFIKLSFILKK